MVAVLYLVQWQWRWRRGQRVESFAFGVIFLTALLILGDSILLSLFWRLRRKPFCSVYPFNILLLIVEPLVSRAEGGA